MGYTRSCLSELQFQILKQSAAMVLQHYILHYSVCEAYVLE